MERRRRLGAGDHLILLDVSNELPPAGADRLVVVVEPTWGSVAVAAALDAGWESVDIKGDDDRAAAPIPLVSFEQRPPADASRCRVRSEDLARVLAPLATHPDTQSPTNVLLGAPALARPLASAINRVAPEAIHLVACPTPDGAMAADSWWACGMLVRVLLEELEGETELTDAAGVAVTVARGAEDAAAQLSAGARWRRHLERGGHADDLRIASAIDSIGVVPRVTREGESLVARAWLPEPVSSLADA